LVEPSAQLQLVAAALLVLQAAMEYQADQALEVLVRAATQEALGLLVRAMAVALEQLAHLAMAEVAVAVQMLLGQTRPLHKQATAALV